MVSKLHKIVIVISLFIAGICALNIVINMADENICIDAVYTNDQVICREFLHAD